MLLVGPLIGIDERARDRGRPIGHATAVDLLKLPFVAATVRTIVRIPDFSIRGQISKMLLVGPLIGIDERARDRGRPIGHATAVDLLEFPFVAATVRTIERVPDFSARAISRGQISKMLLVVSKI